MVGIILSGKIVENSLRVEFGEILPVELPLYNKPLLFHQLEFVNKYCDKVFLTVPTNYISNKISGVETLETSPALKLFEILIEIVEKFSNYDKIMIHYGDSLFLNAVDIQMNKNLIFFQRPTFNYNWGIANEKGNVPAGCFILETSIFKKCLLNSSDFNELILNLFNSESSLIHKVFG